MAQLEWYVVVDLTRPYADHNTAVYRTTQAASRKDALRQFRASEYASELMTLEGSYKVGKMADVFPKHKGYDCTSADMRTVSR